MRFAEHRQLGNEIITKNRQRFRFQIELGQLLEIDEMLRFLAMLQRQILRVPPAIRFTRQKRNPFRSFGCVNETEHIRRKRSQRQFINDSMALIVPGQCALQCNRENQKPGPASQHFFHCKSTAGCLFAIDRSLSAPQMSLAHLMACERENLCAVGKSSGGGNNPPPFFPGSRIFSEGTARGGPRPLPLHQSASLIFGCSLPVFARVWRRAWRPSGSLATRSEEHTSELQSHS